MTTTDETDPPGVMRRVDAGVVHLDLPADFRSVRTVRREVIPFVAHDVDECAQFLVAVSEIVTNAIAEHRRLGVVAPIGVTIDPHVTRRVSVRDHGDGFDLPESQVDRESPHGRGLTIAMAFVPGIAFERRHGSTTVHLPLPATANGLAAD